jgi:hypothetical protein
MNDFRKHSLLTWVLSVTSVALLVANFFIHPDDGRIDLTPAPLPSPSPSAELTEEIKKPETELPAAPAAETNINWSGLETPDYKQYAANLREAGFPPGLVREIVIADLEKLYEEREKALRAPPAPYDAPLSARPRLPFSFESNRVSQLRELLIEKQTALKKMLGEYVPRETLQTSGPRNYESIEYALDLLPAEKREAVQIAQENEILGEAMEFEQNSKNPAVEMAAYKNVVETLHAALTEVLTPGEFERFEMNTTPVGAELARRTLGMEPSDDELQTMFRLTSKYWDDIGGVYERWQARPEPPERIRAAEQELEAGLRVALGADRYLDYQMATSETGQQLRNLADRYGLSRETLVASFELQTELDQLGGATPRFQYPLIKAPTLNPAERTTQGQELQQRLQELLGVNVWRAWTLGRSLRVSLTP